jgi:hypothetical protein
MFVLPSNCPASAYYTGDDEAVGYIRYKVTANFKDENDAGVKDLKAKCHLVVRQMAPSALFNNSASEEVDIKNAAVAGHKEYVNLNAILKGVYIIHLKQLKLLSILITVNAMWM